jgi:flavin-dependent dehydrogenase
MLLDRARAHGVEILQPATVRLIQGQAGDFTCDIAGPHRSHPLTIRARTIVDAHGSWQRGPAMQHTPTPHAVASPSPADLIAFKAVFEATTLEPGLLAVIAMDGGYGGMVLADHGLATLACCLRRDTLAACRRTYPDVPAGQAVESFLLDRCMGVREALRGARRNGNWLAVGPLRTGRHEPGNACIYRIGNAAGESHPLIGEGISMAVESAHLLATELLRIGPAAMRAEARTCQRRYLAAWHKAFSGRLRTAAICAHIAMRPTLAGPARAVLVRHPALLTMTARLAGKAREQGSSFAQESPA